MTWRCSTPAAGSWTCGERPVRSAQPQPCGGRTTPARCAGLSLCARVAAEPPLPAGRARRFPDGLEPRFAPGMQFVAAESATTYFESYQHTMRALQSVAADSADGGLPFADHLLRCKAAVSPPAYLRRPGADRYGLGDIFPTLEADTGRPAVHVLGEWPSAGAGGSVLDDSQVEAVRTALSRELALIQGPPGTGKTFVGLKVVKALLDNYRVRRQAPLVIVCYTNHALDQARKGLPARPRPPPKTEWPPGCRP